MDCCGLSSTGLKNIDANEITLDNRTIFSKSNVSGFSNLNELLDTNINSLNSTTTSILGYINNHTRYSFLSTNGLDFSGFTTLKNNTCYHQ